MAINPNLVVRITANIDDLLKNLKLSEDQIKRLEPTSASMAKAFQTHSDSMITRAVSLTAAIQAVGVSTLNTRDSVSSLKQLDAAMEQLARTGQPIPDQMRATADSLREVTSVVEPAATATGNWTDQVRSFDGVLSALGIHIGPEIRAMTELGAAGSQTALSLGLLATAGLVAGAAIGGWKIGRAVSEFTGLDEIIGRATAKLLGWGDLSAETAGAKTDALALASQRAGREITNLSEAMKFNADWTALARKGHEMMASALADSDKEAIAYNQSLTRMAEALMKAQEAADLNIKTIADKLFGVDDIKRATDYADAIGRVENVANMNAEAQAEVEKVMRKGIEAMVAAGMFESMRLAATQTARDTANAQAMVAMSVVQTIMTVKSAAASLTAVEAGLLGLTPYGWSDPGGGAAAHQSKGSGVTSFVGPIASGSTYEQFYGIPSMGLGGPINSDGPIYAHAGEMVVPKGGMLVSEGGGTVLNIYVTQPLGTPDAIGKAIMANLRMQGVRLPVGA
jgi:hypothetical protein